MNTQQNAVPTVGQDYLKELDLVQQDIVATRAVLENPMGSFSTLGEWVDFSDQACRVYAERCLELISVIQWLCGADGLKVGQEAEPPVIEETPERLREWKTGGEQLVLGEVVA